MSGTLAADDTIEVLGTNETFTQEGSDFKLGELTITGLTVPTTTNALGTVENGTVSYIASSTAGAAPSEQGAAIVYQAASDTALFTIIGIANADNLGIGTDGVVTLNASNLNGESVAIFGAGYTLALANESCCRYCRQEHHIFRRHAHRSVYNHGACLDRRHHGQCGRRDYDQCGEFEHGRHGCGA